MRLQKLTAMAVALGLAAGAAQSAPFRMVTDEPGSVWLLDAGSGALARCVARAPAGAKVLDVFGATAEARPQTVHTGRTVCREVREAQVDPREHRLRAILRARTGTLADLYAVPRLGDGSWGRWPGAGRIDVIWLGTGGLDGY
jgi:hypothetical protein